MRMEACGQPSEQSPHWMQIFGSQMGISSAIERFSYCVVPVGNVPSTGMALTGRSSPRLAIIMPSTSLTKAGAWSGTGGTMWNFELTEAGTLTSCRLARAMSMAALLRSTIAPPPFLPYDGLDLGLDFADGLVRRNDVGQLEEAGLHHRVDADAQFGLAGHLVGVDHVELQLLVDDLLLHFAGQVVPDLVRAVGAVQEERRPRQGHREHVDPLGELELVAGHEVRLVDEVRALDRPRAEADVRGGDRTGLPRVVDEVALRVHRRVLADDLHRTAVGAHGAVAAQAEEHGPRHVVAFGREIVVRVEAQEGHVVLDADDEPRLRLGLRQFVVHGLHVGRREFLRAQAVAAADDLRQRTVPTLGHRRDDVLVERLAVGARLFRAIQARRSS